MSLGAVPTIAEIRDELGQGLPYTFPDARTRWMAGVGVADPLTFPSSFANKSRVRILDTQTLSSPGSDINFTGLDVGEIVDGRMLVAAIGVVGTSGSAIGVPAQPEVNGIGATADAAYYTNGSGHSVATCISSLDDITTTGTNGSARLQTSGATIANAICVLMAVYDTVQASPFDRGNFGAVANATDAADSVNVGARGQIITACTQYNNEVATVSGVTKRFETNLGAGRFTLGFDTLLAAETARSITFSWTAAAVRSSAFQSRTN
ncbi:hypothetical protein IWQ49_006357 [Labrenzia sp. EL_126]|nr:hypothetical protein [Labrenzia sp. EL_126]